MSKSVLFDRKSVLPNAKNVENSAVQFFTIFLKPLFLLTFFFFSAVVLFKKYIFNKKKKRKNKIENKSKK